MSLQSVACYDFNVTAGAESASAVFYWSGDELLDLFCGYTHDLNAFMRLCLSRDNRDIFFTDVERFGECIDNSLVGFTAFRWSSNFDFNRGIKRACYLITAAVGNDFDGKSDCSFSLLYIKHEWD